MKTNKDNVDEYILKNREYFNDVEPSDNHCNRFYVKLYNRFKKFISIVPYLIKTLIITIITFIISIWLWNSYIRKDRHDVTLKQKIENIIKTPVSKKQ